MVRSNVGQLKLAAVGAQRKPGSTTGCADLEAVSHHTGNPCGEEVQEPAHAGTGGKSLCNNARGVLALHRQSAFRTPRSRFARRPPGSMPPQPLSTSIWASKLASWQRAANAHMLRPRGRIRPLAALCSHWNSGAAYGRLTRAAYGTLVTCQLTVSLGAVLQARRRPALPSHQRPLRAWHHPHHHQHRLQTLAAHLQQRRHPHFPHPRSPPPPLRNRHHRRRQLPYEGQTMNQKGTPIPAKSGASTPASTVYVATAPRSRVDTPL